MVTFLLGPVKKEPIEWAPHSPINDVHYHQSSQSSLTPLIKAFLARGPGPSTVLPSSSGPHEAE